MPKVTEEHIEARRHQIMDAAAACFCRNGFHQSTMQEICRQAELSPGAIYGYFASKEEIIESMIRERQAQTATIMEAIRGRGGTLEVLDEMADVFFVNLEDPQKCAVNVELWAEALRSTRMRELVLNELANITGPIAEIVEQAQESGEINEALDPQAVAQVMVSFFDGLVLQKATDNRIDVWKYVAVMKAMMGGSFWQANGKVKERS